MRSLINTVTIINEHKLTARIESLIVFPTFDCAWLPVIEDGIYDLKYYMNFESYKSTKVGDDINYFRSSLVKTYGVSRLLDIGAGAGHFLEMFNKRGLSFGFDINEHSVAYLKQTGQYSSADQIEKYEALTFWDSFEHIVYCWNYLMCVKPSGYVFMTIPCFESLNDVKASKHYKPREHYWYFTEGGIRRFMNEFGFTCLDVRNDECRFGREEVKTFVFRKRITSP